MSSESDAAAAEDEVLLDEARAGDEAAFSRLVEGYRADLHAHCYRMLGSVHDADDALQDTLLRAWRGLPTFEGRSSLRSWLYRIATNVCLDVIEQRQRRVLPTDHAPATTPEEGLGDPLVETVWVEPYPDEQIGLEEGPAAPEANYERRESVELAFIAALQHLPGTQRAALLLRDVLGFSAREAAEALDTTVASVNGALRRARTAMSERLPERSQQTTLRTLGDARVRALVEAFVDAWERGDADAIVALLAEDATFEMPPLPTWFRGREAIAGFVTRFALQDRWRVIPTRANGQLAFGAYAWDAAAGSYLALAFDVVTVEGTRLTAVTSFVTPYTAGPARARFAADVFGRFGLPPRID